MESNHTPGYWLPSSEEPVYNPIGAYQKAIGATESEIITAFAFGKTKEECKANAFLISVAPVMYKYVKEMAEQGEPMAKKIMGYWEYQHNF